MLGAGNGVVVTGAAGGIGRALAIKFAAQGCRVVIADLGTGDTRDKLTNLATEIGAYPVVADMSTDDGVQALHESARTHLGAIDAWYGNAGVDCGRGLTTTDEDWLLSYEVNVMAHVRAARVLLPEWLAQGHGRYVVTASAAGLLTMLTAPAYSVSKHGAIAFAEWLAATYRHRGVISQAICPQGVTTTMLNRIGHVRAVLERDRVLTPADVAEHTWNAAQDDRFLILPHPEVAGYYRSRATDTDRWLRTMNRLQQDLDTQTDPHLGGCHASQEIN